MNDTVEYINKKNIEYIKFKRLNEYDNLFHAITLKKYNTGFKIKNNDKTREISVNKIKDIIKVDNIIQLKQNHTDNILISNDDIFEKSKNTYADGIITNKKNQASIITIADCIPIIIYDPRKNVIANIHSGWKGTVQKIGIKAIEKMQKEFQSNKTDIIFCIGPCIRKECFLVNEDVVEIYQETFKNEINLDDIIEKTDLTNEKGIQYRIDNVKLYKKMVKKIGLLEKNIIDSNICTMCNSDEFHSRRKEGENYQTNGSITMLK